MRQRVHCIGTPVGLRHLVEASGERYFWGIQRRERKCEEDNQRRERNKVHKGTDLWHSGKAGQEMVKKCCG